MGNKSAKEPSKSTYNFQDSGYICGLIAYPKDNKDGKSTTIPLKFISYDINIFNALAEVNLTQTYKNSTDKYLELFYQFPVSPAACLYKFTATFANKRLQGTVKEKEQARKEYITAVSSGKQAAYGELNEDSIDIMNLKLGNLAPNEQVKIQISYIWELSLTLNTFYCFNFLAKLTPRYSNSVSAADFRKSFRNPIKLSQGDFKWDFKLRIRSTRKIVSYHSISHKTVLENKNDSLTDLTLTLQKDQILDKDFTFIYTTEEFQIPSYTLGRTDVATTVMVSFVPKFCTLNLEDAKLASIKAQNFEIDMDAVKGQYIFLLDRSGSMGGQRIQNAKKALVLFLKSLPIDTYFNVVSFGSTSQKLFPNSVKNSNVSITEAVNRISAVDADLGGTEIEQPLSQILHSNVIEGYPKLIFLLTDGEVDNTEKVIDLVRKNIKYSRVHTIGIGSGASQALIKGCAEKGKGYSIFIKDNQNPSSKIIQLLTDSLTPVISKVSLVYDKELVESVVPNPQKIPYILKNDVANFYITFKGHLTQKTAISLRYSDSLNNNQFESKIQVLPDSPSQVFVDKMGHFKSIRALEQSEAQGSSVQDLLYFVKVTDKKKQIIDLSVKHQILSKHTAFLCVQKQLIDGKYQQIKQKGQQQVQIVTVTKPAPRKKEQLYLGSFQCYSVPSKSSYIPSLMSNLSAPMSRQMNMKCAIQKQQECMDYEDQCAQEQLNRNQCDIIPQYKQMEIEKICIQNDCLQKQQCMDDLDGVFQAKIMDKQQNQQQICDKKMKKKKKQSKPKSYNITEIINEQQFEGFWDNISIIQSLLGKDTAGKIQQLEDVIAVITYLIVKWIQKHHPQKEYALIVKKSNNWLKKQPNFKNYSSSYDKYVK